MTENKQPHPPTPSSPPATSQRQGQLWLGLGLSVVSIVAILLLIDPAEIWATLQTADYRYLLVSAVCTVLFLVFRAFRWHLLLQQQASWSQLFHIQNIGYLLTMLLPFRLGDVARVGLIGTQPRVSVAQGLSTMVVERIFDLLFFAILLPLTMTRIQQFPPELRGVAAVAAGLSLTGLLVLIVAANQRARVLGLTTAVVSHLPLLKKSTPFWAKQADGILSGLSSLTRWRDALQLLFWSILIWLPVIFAYYIMMVAVGLTVTPAEAAFVTSVAAFSVAAPSSPGQFGVFHASVTFALALLGQPEAAAVSFAILYHLSYYVMMILMGIIGLLGAGTTFGRVVALARKRGKVLSDER